MSAPASRGRDHDWVMEQAQKIVAAGESAPRPARDPVNRPMVNNWVEAMGDANPVYVDGAAAAEVHGQLVAPPAMVQVWTMYGLNPARDPNDPLYAAMTMLDEAGFTSVIATNSDQVYDRYLGLGEQVSVTTRLESVVGPKVTALGEGYFVTTVSTWYVGDERVATMTFRVLKFTPSAPETDHTDSEQAPEAAFVLRPQINRDTAFFWEGTRAGELRVQKCAACGALRHPPGPMCPHCHATARTYVVSEGRGTIYSYAVHHHPPIPGRELPILLVLVQLDDGVRMVGELLDATADLLEIGAAVEISMSRVDDDLTIPAWRLV
jgi:uncharacterized OB-fold protein